MALERKGLFQWSVRAAAAVILLALAGCRPGESLPAQAQDGYPSAGYPPASPTQTAAGESYPGSGEPEALLLSTETYPVPESDNSVGPVKVSARPNGSRVTAELIEAMPYEEKPEYVRLRVRLISSQALEGMASVTDELIDQEMYLLIKTAQLPDLQPGETFEAEVSFLGDEYGANYYILNILGTSD